MKTRTKRITALTMLCVLLLSCTVAYAASRDKAADKSKDKATQDNADVNTSKNQYDSGSLSSSGSTSTTGATNTSVRGKNANNSNAGFTSSDGDANNALVYRMGLARLTNEEVIYSNDIESKALAVQQCGAKYYVATQGASYVYGYGASLATNDYRGNACIAAPAGSLSEQVLQGIFNNTPVTGVLGQRADGSLFIFI